MTFLQKIKPEWPLRLGLGFMYLYSGYDLIVKPSHWYGFMPKWFSALLQLSGPPLGGLSRLDLYLRVQGLGELLLALLFLAWFLPRVGVRIAAFVAAVEMALILFLVGIDPITFRDIGLLGGVVTLCILLYEGRDDDKKGRSAEPPQNN